MRRGVSTSASTDSSGRLIAAERALGLLAGLQQPRPLHGALAQLDAVLAPEGVGHRLAHRGVEVVAAEPGVAGAAEHAEVVGGDVHDAEVEGAAAEVVDPDDLVLLLAHPVDQRAGDRLGQRLDDLEAGQLRGDAQALAAAPRSSSRDGEHDLRIGRPRNPCPTRRGA
jgi:streptomycin 6-kinase